MSEWNEKVRQHLRDIGRGESRYGHAHVNGDGAEARAAAGHGEPPHEVKRHPEDPRDALEGAATEIVDPEEIRRMASRLGKTLQGIDPAYFETLVRGLYRAVHDTRIGAITIPSQRQAGEQLKVVAGVDTAIAAIQIEGNADAAKADRLEATVVPRVEAERDAAEAAEEKADHELEAARETLARVREEEEEKREKTKTERPRPSVTSWGRRSTRNLFARVGFSPWKAGLTFAFEVFGSGYLLAPNVADVVGTSWETGFGISLVISVALLSAAFAAGIGLAAIRLPGWAVGTAILAAFGAILVKFVPALDALRHAGESGVETLTAATLGAFLIAVVSGYALSVAADDEGVVSLEAEETDLLRRAGSPLGDAIEAVERAEASKSAAVEEKSRCRKLLDALWEKIEKLRDDASRSEAAAEKRRQLGVEADVEVETIRATAQSAIEQEESAAEWAIIIAIASQEKFRVEELPDPAAPAVVGAAPSPGEGPKGLSLLQKAALAVVAAAGVTSLFLGLVPLGIGIPLAALLVVLDQGSEARGNGDETDGPGNQRPRIVATANGDNPLYRYQPDRMNPKYGDGGADAGEHQ